MATPPAAIARPDGSPWPRVSIVTPSYRQAPFLEETIRSVLLQGYPNLQYIVIDGASDDGSREILERYAPWLDLWVSEPDRGQSEAINKGFARTDGAILAWLNSDDVYLQGTLVRVAVEMAQAGVEWVAGDCRWRADGEPGVRIASNVEATLPDWFSGSQVQQPASFWSRGLHDRLGGPDESLQFVMDQELFMRFRAADVRPRQIPEELAVLRLHPASKTVSSTRRFREESLSAVVPRYLRMLAPADRRRARALLAEKVLRNAREDLTTGEYVTCGRNLLRGFRWDPVASARISLDYLARGLFGGR